MAMNTSQLQAPPAGLSETNASKQLFPFLDLKAEFSSIRDEVLALVENVLASQRFIMGPEVGQFEAQVAKLLGSGFAISCASGSDALMLALMALGVDAGDEVITVPFTFVATAGSVARLKAKPVFVDIDPTTYNLDWRQVEAAITPRTKAIIPVHLFGLPAEMARISEIANAHRIAVIEDAAQAIGARYRDQYVGNFGSCGCFSFFPSKNLGGAGDGGMITSNDPELADRISVLRTHGSREKYHYDFLGMNSRLDTLQAAILMVKLRYLPLWTKARQRNAERYRRLFAQSGLNHLVTLPVQPEGFEHVYNQFVIRAQRRDELREYLRQAGIPSEIYYPVPLHLQPAFSFLGYGIGAFPQAEAASQEVLALPVFPTMSEQQQQAVVQVIGNFFAEKN
jgi:dTDP-4-amino-4,6-dideoxygalactose transaminase